MAISLELPSSLLDELEARLLERLRDALEPATENAPGWLSDKEAGAYCTVAARTVRRWRERGLPYHVVGGLTRIRRDELDEWLSSRPRVKKN